MSDLPAIEELIQDDPSWILLRRSSRVCAFFNANAIIFNHSDMAPDPHYPIMIGKAGAIEQYSQRSGNVASPMGAMSYLYSEQSYPGLDVGRYCSIGSGLVIFGERHPIEAVTTSNLPYCETHLFGRVHQEVLGGRWPWADAPDSGAFPRIGHDVWIGQDVKLARNVVIGTGAVVGAGAIVTRSVPPYTIVAGNPARPIRRRFDEALADALLASRWWELHPDCLFRFDRGDPVRFLDQIAAARAGGTLANWQVRAFTWRDIVDEIAALPA